MATPVADLAVQIGADITPLMRDTKRGSDAVERFAKTARRSSDRFTAGVDRMNVSSGRMRSSVQNAAFQIGDFAVQVGAGTSAMRAMAMQMPQLLGGFGVLGAVGGAAFAIIAPLAGALFAGSDGADELTKSVKDLNPTLGGIRGNINGLAELQERYAKAIAASGGASNTAAARIAANSAREFEARKQVLKVELDILRIRSTEMQSKLKEAQEKQRQLVKEAADQFNMLRGTSPAQTDTGGYAYTGPRTSADILGENFERISRDRRNAIRKMSAELELLQLAGDEAAHALEKVFTDVSGGSESADPLGEKEKKGGGTSTSTKIAQLTKDLSTQREITDAWYESSLEKLMNAGAAELEALGGINAAKLRLEQEYQARIDELRQKERDVQLTAYGKMFGNMATIFEAGGKKLVGVTKMFSIAQGILNSYRAFTEVLADPSLQGRPFLRYPLAASTLGAGLAQVANMRSVGYGSTGGGSGGSTAAAAPAAAPPASYYNVNLVVEGGFGQKQFRDFVSMLNEAIEDGAVIRGITIG